MELRAEQMMELSRISDEELEKVNDGTDDREGPHPPPHGRRAPDYVQDQVLHVKDTVAKQVCEEVHYVVRYRDMAGQECTHGAMDMVNVFKQLSWEYKVTDDQTSAMTLLYLQEGDRASKKGHTQSTLSMTSKHMPINQIKKIEEVTNPTTRAQPSHNDGVKDRRVLLNTTSDCCNNLRSKQLCYIGS